MVPIPDRRGFVDSHAARHAFTDLAVELVVAINARTDSDTGDQKN